VEAFSGTSLLIAPSTAHPIRQAERSRPLPACSYLPGRVGTCDDRQSKPECGAPSWSAPHPYGAVVPLDDLITDVEPQSQASTGARPRVHSLYTPKAFPEMFQFLRLYTRTPIANHNLCLQDTLISLFTRRALAGFHGLEPERECDGTLDGRV